MTRYVWLLLVSLLLFPVSALATQGIVVDESTGQPIAEAIVRVRATEVRTFTNQQGRFQFDVPVESGERIVAGAKGYFYAGVDHGPGDLVIALEPVGYSPHAELPFISPTECKTCHPQQYNDWIGSAMAHAGRNSWVYDLYNGTGTPGGTGAFVYTRDSEHALANKESECAACHNPERWLHDPGAAMPAYQNIEEADIRGVSCMLCHGMADIDVSLSNFPGPIEGVARMQRGKVVRFGMLGDVDFHSPGRMRASYQPQLEADLCSACHQDSSDPHGNWTFDGPVSEPTYVEWAESEYGNRESPLYESCAHCHSSAVDTPRASLVGDDYTRPIGEVRTHTFEGTTAEFLEKAVTLNLDAEIVDGRLRVRANVKNTGTGHHVPTGVTIRNMILLVEVASKGSALQQVSGPVLGELAGVGDPAQGYYAGLPGVLYAKINEDRDGNGPTFFTEAMRIRSDNRIPALAEDRSEYQFELPPGQGEIEVRARVIYRRSWRYLVDANAWTTDGHGRPLVDLQAPHFGHLMAEANLALANKPPGRLSGSGCSTVQSVDPSPGWLFIIPGILFVVRRFLRWIRGYA